VTGDSSRLRLSVLGMVVLSLFAALLARLWFLQVMASPTYRVEAQQNSVRVVQTEGPRGRILDRNGKVLADNRVVLAVVVRRDEIGRRPDVMARLAGLLGGPEADLRDRMADERFSPYKPVPVATEVPKEKLIYIREHQSDFPGVEGVQLTQRVYPNGTLAAHVLGYVGEINDKELAPRKAAGYKAGDTIGKYGAEVSYEDDLRGTPQIEKLEVDSSGRVLRTLGEQKAVQGHDVRLTIDIDVQRLAEESLAQGLDAAHRAFDDVQLKHFLAPAGSVVVLDPRDGSVLAMASNPVFDPNAFVNGISVADFAKLQDPEGHFPLNNRAIQGLYAPGSTFKLATSLAGLRDGLISPRDTYDDTGSYTVTGERSQTYTNARHTVNGRVNVVSALTVSSDVFFYWLGERFWNNQSKYGKAAVQDAARSLGMGDYTDVDLPFELDGRVSDPAARERIHKANPKAFPTGEWFTGDNVVMAVGQGETVVTPLQLANAYATFANGGTVYAPHVGGAVLDQDQELRRIEPKVVKKTELPPAVRDPMMTGFKGAVADPKGTAFGAFAGFPLNRFPVAGKTGTAEVTGKQDTSLFVAFGPADDAKYVVAAVLEESGLGASAAAPMVRRVFDGLAGMEGVSGAALQQVGRVAGKD
jgi:penicillin-binding protein 2